MYIATQNDNPIPGGTGSDYVKVCIAAEDWAEYSQRRVHVIEITAGIMADVKCIIIPKDKS